MMVVVLWFLGFGTEAGRPRGRGFDAARLRWGPGASKRLKAVHQRKEASSPLQIRWLLPKCVAYLRSTRLVAPKPPHGGSAPAPAQQHQPSEEGEEQRRRGEDHRRRTRSASSSSRRSGRSSGRSRSRGRWTRRTGVRLRWY